MRSTAPFVRQSADRKSWALYAHDGDRFRRVGTARTAREYLEHLGFAGDELDRMVALHEERIA